MEYTDVHVHATIPGGEAEARQILDAALERIKRMCPGVTITLQRVKASAAHLRIGDLPRHLASLKLISFLSQVLAKTADGRVQQPTLGDLAAVTENHLRHLAQRLPHDDQPLVIEAARALLHHYDMDFSR